MAEVQVEHLSDLVAQHLGRLPQQAGHRRVGGQRAHLGAAGQAVLGVGPHRHPQVDPLGIGGQHGLAGGAHDQHPEGVVAGRLGDPAVGGREGLGLDPRCVGGGEATVADPVVERVGPGVEQQPEGGGIPGAQQHHEGLVALAAVGRGTAPDPYRPRRAARSSACPMLMTFCRPTSWVLFRCPVASGPLPCQLIRRPEPPPASCRGPPPGRPSGWPRGWVAPCRACRGPPDGGKGRSSAERWRWWWTGAWPPGWPDP